MKTGKSIIEIKILPGQFVYGRLSAAKELNMKPSTVRNRMKKLQDMQNLDIKEDSQYSIVSIINWATYQPLEINMDIKEDSQRTAKGQSKDTDKNDKNVKNEKKDIKPLHKSFDLFWNEYPKKKSKGYAEKVWEKIKPDEQLVSAILSKIKLFKISDDWTKKNGKYIPYPASWLNSKGWEDEIDIQGITDLRVTNGIYSETTAKNIKNFKQQEDE